MPTAKGRIEQVIQQCADGANDLDLREGIGTPGFKILLRGETTDTGAAFTVEPPATGNFLSCLLEGVASELDAAAIAWANITGSGAPTAGARISNATVGADTVTLTFSPAFVNADYFVAGFLIGFALVQSLEVVSRSTSSAVLRWRDVAAAPISLAGKTMVVLAVGVG